MMAPASFPVEQLSCLCSRLDIGPPPGLEHLAPSKPQGNATAIVAKRVRASDNSPMYVDPVLLEPFFLSSSELSPRTVDPDVAAQVADWSSQSASTTASTVVSPRASESSSTMLPLFGHETLSAVGFCGTYSKGSLLHAHGTCKPCDFSRRGGCRAGIDCPFCHLCTEADARRKKKLVKRAARQLRK
eukprot:TRINITY_DN2716_c0_g1_i1.p1 TRINITY_DN2716_c0_g1~~TRINITY_DN2716_c0_g1_i1.p1  ORF type:complete len:187 (-),score=29.54 TRINITY_DN2716_c0_g1_i1:760-1320(-)